MTECAICMELVDTSDRKTSKTLKCSHTFHKECILEWLDVSRGNRTCPLCRQSLTSREQDIAWAIDECISIEMNYRYGCNYIANVEYDNTINRLENHKEYKKYIDLAINSLIKENRKEDFYDKRTEFIQFIIRVVCDECPSGVRGKKLKCGLRTIFEDVIENDFDSNVVMEWWDTWE